MGDFIIPQTPESLRNETGDGRYVAHIIDLSKLSDNELIRRIESTDCFCYSKPSSVFVRVGRLDTG